mmetsp:Transcript_104152/g.335863  ORF Transcript_104152/g.335863 Transcript_104152/m.335863 type:complete len:411 (-) Transcript_104152:1182-2414(-)
MQPSVVVAVILIGDIPHVPEGLAGCLSLGRRLGPEGALRLQELGGRLRRPGREGPEQLQVPRVERQALALCHGHLEAPALLGVGLEDGDGLDEGVVSAEVHEGRDGQAEGQHDLGPPVDVLLGEHGRPEQAVRRAARVAASEGQVLPQAALEVLAEELPRVEPHPVAQAVALEQPRQAQAAELLRHLLYGLVAEQARAARLALLHGCTSLDPLLVLHVQGLQQGLPDVCGRVEPRPLLLPPLVACPLRLGLPAAEALEALVHVEEVAKLAVLVAHHLLVAQRGAAPVDVGEVLAGDGPLHAAPLLHRVKVLDADVLPVCAVPRRHLLLGQAGHPRDNRQADVAAVRPHHLVAEAADLIDGLDLQQEVAEVLGAPGPRGWAPAQVLRQPGVAAATAAPHVGVEVQRGLSTG